ncbi:MAG: hypothetical protein QF724_13450, partial [Planctomycetota bacterium]|nr:hypothetical protein [Planctomycetota bacterium]
PLIREAAMTLDLCKFDLPMIQEAYLGARDFAAAASGRDGLNDAGLGQHPPGQPPTAELAHWWRAYFLHRRKVGGYVVGSGVRPRLREVRWFLEAREERPLPRDEIQEHILAIQAKALRFKGTAGKTR